MVSSGLKIDWTQMPTYNTIMAVAAGAALLTLVWFGRSLLKKEVTHLEGWSLALAVPGAILTLTGLHMTLTWPFAKYFPFDNIIFGEPSLAFGVLLLAGALYLWRRGTVIEASGDPLMHLSKTVRPLSIFIFGMVLRSGLSRSRAWSSNFLQRRRKSRSAGRSQNTRGSRRSSCLDLSASPVWAPCSSHSLCRGRHSHRPERGCSCSSQFSGD